jgi:hypothetical protein
LPYDLMSARQRASAARLSVSAARGGRRSPHFSDAGFAVCSVAGRCRAHESACGPSQAAVSPQSQPEAASRGPYRVAARTARKVPRAEHTDALAESRRLASGASQNCLRFVATPGNRREARTFSFRRHIGHDATGVTSGWIPPRAVGIWPTPRARC